MSSILKKARDLVTKSPSSFAPNVVKTSYTSIPVDIPEDFLAPLSDASAIKTEKIDFAKTPLPEYQECYAAVLDNVLSHDECRELLHMTEQSAGGHRDDEEVPNNGWRVAMVNAGAGQEFLAPDYRNSDRIIWDNKVIVKRLWTRVMQGEGIKEALSVLEGREYNPVLGDLAVRRGEKWVVTEQGINERMRFLKYGPGQFFKAHCDGTYFTPDEKQQSFYTIHLYLNDSLQELEKEQHSTTPPDGAASSPALKPTLRGGATTFHSRDMRRRLDVDPRAGRVLIFQHRRLLHSGDDVVEGIKYTMRSDLMYAFAGYDDGGDGSNAEVSG